MCIIVSRLLIKNYDKNIIMTTTNNIHDNIYIYIYSDYTLQHCGRRYLVDLRRTGSYEI